MVNGYTPSTADNDLNEQYVRQLKYLEQTGVLGIGVSSLSNSLLVGTGYKEGTDITFNPDATSVADVEQYVDVMTELGADVYVDMDIDTPSPYSGEIIATTADASVKDLQQIVDVDRNLSPEQQKLKARVRGYPEEAVQWYMDEETTTVVPDKLRGIFDCSVPDEYPLLMEFAIKADETVFDEYVQEYAVPRLNALQRIEEEYGYDIVPPTVSAAHTQDWWREVKEDCLPFDVSSDLQRLAEEYIEDL